MNEWEWSFPKRSWRHFKKISNCMQLLGMQSSETCMHSRVDGIFEDGWNILPRGRIGQDFCRPAAEWMDVMFWRLCELMAKSLKWLETGWGGYSLTFLTFSHFQVFFSLSALPALPVPHCCQPISCDPTLFMSRYSILVNIFPTDIRIIAADTFVWAANNYWTSANKIA